MFKYVLFCVGLFTWRQLTPFFSCYVVCTLAGPFLPAKDKCAVHTSTSYNSIGCSTQSNSDNSSCPNGDTWKKLTYPTKLGSCSELDDDSSEEMVGSCLLYSHGGGMSFWLLNWSILAKIGPELSNMM